MSSRSEEELNVAQVLAGLRSSSIKVSETQPGGGQGAPSSQGADNQPECNIHAQQDERKHGDEVEAAEALSGTAVLQSYIMHGLEEPSTTSDRGDVPSYPEASGRVSVANTGARKLVLKADTRNLGYKTATPATRPDLFHTPEQQAAKDRQPDDFGANALENLAAISELEQQKIEKNIEKERQAAEAYEEAQEAVRAEVSEVDNDETGDYGAAKSKGKGKTRAKPGSVTPAAPAARKMPTPQPLPAMGGAEAAQDHGEGEPEPDQDGDQESDEGQTLVPLPAGYVETAPWVPGDLRLQPLTYNVPTAARSEQRELRNAINTHDKVALRKANKAREQAVRRAKEKLGMAPMRQSTAGREYTATHENWLALEMATYASANNNAAISWRDLAARFNAHFPGQNRSQGSISAHVSRTQDLKTARAQYDGAADEPPVEDSEVYTDEDSEIDMDE